MYQSGSGPAILTGITVSGQQVLFNVNDPFDFGGTVTATYSNGTTADVTNAAVFDTQYVDMSTAGVYIVYVYYIVYYRVF